jgi:hypothetical protein
MEKYQHIIDHINAWEIDKAFQALDELVGADHELARLKKEYIFGTKDFDFANRLLTYVGTLDVKTPEKKEENPSTSRVINQYGEKSVYVEKVDNFTIN